MKPLVWCPALLAALLAACTPPGSPQRQLDDVAAPAVSMPAAPAPPAAIVAPGAQPAPQPADPAREAQVDARIDQDLGDHVAYRGALQRLRVAVARDDRSGVAALVRYPLDARTGAGRLRIRNAQDFVAHYPDIVTPAIARAITAQRYADLFVSQDGVMLGAGEVWLNGTCHDPACVDIDVKVVTFQNGG
jgi:hypothetical protein